MVRKEIEIDGKVVPFKASGATPLIYRRLFGRDMFKDMSRLADSAPEETYREKDGGSEFSIEDLSLFENVSYCMAKQADSGVPDMEEWYDQFEVFSIYSVLPELIDLWRMNQMTDVESKKKLRLLQEK